MRRRLLQRGLLLAWVGLGLAGCAARHAPVQVGVGVRSPPTAAQIAAVGARLQAEAVTAAASWSTEVVHTTGMEAAWCTAPEAPGDCWGRTARPGHHWRSLTAQEGSVAWEAGVFTDADGWGGTARLDLIAGQPSDYEIVLVRISGGRETDRWTLSPTLDFSLEQTTFQLGPGEAAPNPAGALVAALASPGALGGWARGRVDALAALSLEGIDQHELRKCAYGRYHGDGSPRCDPVPLSATEEAAARAHAEAEFERRRQQLEHDAEALHALVCQLVPLGPRGCP